MANLTITIDDDVLHRARRRALEQRTSVNALLRDYLERYVGDGTTNAALTGFLELARSSQARSGRKGRTWTRDDAHDRSTVR